MVSNYPLIVSVIDSKTRTLIEKMCFSSVLMRQEKALGSQCVLGPVASLGVSCNETITEAEQLTRLYVYEYHDICV